MKKLSFRSILMTSYSFAFAILLTAYLNNNSYLLNSYIVPILFSAYYFNLSGGIISVIICSGLGLYYSNRAGLDISSPMMVIQLITFSVVGLIAGIFQWENNKLNKQLLHAALTDRLTGLYNYGTFIKRMQEELHRAEKYKHALSLIMIDIDNFKSFNDKYGHQKGNQVLVKISNLLMNNTSRLDIVFRYGGEEFCVIVPDSIIEAKALAEKLRQKVVEEKFAGDIKVTISAGVSCYQELKAEAGANIIDKADKALYEAKKTGRNKVCVA